MTFGGLSSSWIEILSYCEEDSIHLSLLLEDLFSPVQMIIILLVGGYLHTFTFYSDKFQCSIYVSIQVAASPHSSFMKSDEHGSLHASLCNNIWHSHLIWPFTKSE